jgi:hypothetical protein
MNEWVNLPQQTNKKNITSFARRNRGSVFLFLILLLLFVRGFG